MTPDPKYAGSRGIPNPSEPIPEFGRNDPDELTEREPIPEFGRNDPDELKDEPPYDRMDPEELGDEFRGIVSDAISKAIMDPNPQNSKKSKQLTDVMKGLNPQWPDEHLDPEARNRYVGRKFPMKPHNTRLPPNPKIGIKAADKEVHVVDMGMKVNFGSFDVPDI